MKRIRKRKSKKKRRKTKTNNLSGRLSHILKFYHIRINLFRLVRCLQLSSNIEFEFRVSMWPIFFGFGQYYAWQEHTICPDIWWTNGNFIIRSIKHKHNAIFWMLSSIWSNKERKRDRERERDDIINTHYGRTIICMWIANTTRKRAKKNRLVNVVFCSFIKMQFYVMYFMCDIDSFIVFILFLALNSEYCAFEKVKPFDRSNVWSK